jgi:hypothetical protein
MIAPKVPGFLETARNGPRGATPRQCDSRQCARSRGYTGGAVRGFLDQYIRFFSQTHGVLPNFSFKIGRKPFQSAHSHENIRSPFKKRCHVHNAFSLVLRERRPGEQRMDLHHIGEPSGAHGRERTGLIGSSARIAQVEIVFKMTMRANK